MAPVTDGFWPLVPADAGQPPLFLASMHCFRSILGPGLESYLGIIFFLLALGMNLASTYCELLCGVRIELAVESLPMPSLFGGEEEGVLQNLKLQVHMDSNNKAR